MFGQLLNGEVVWRQDDKRAPCARCSAPRGRNVARRIDAARRVDALVFDNHDHRDSTTEYIYPKPRSSLRSVWFREQWS